MLIHTNAASIKAQHNLCLSIDTLGIPMPCLFPGQCVKSAQKNANLSRTPILQQSGTGMVSETKPLPQSVLK